MTSSAEGQSGGAPRQEGCTAEEGESKGQQVGGAAFHARRDHAKQQPRLGGDSKMLLEPLVKPCCVQGAGDAVLRANMPPHLERFWNALLLLAVLHFLLQMAVYVSCLFLVLPMSFVVSNVICGANTIMSATSSETVLAERQQSQGAGEGTQEEELCCPQGGMEELVLSLATAYFLLRAGLVFCNLVFVLPLLFFLNAPSSH
ncbi:uncharacterized protein LOC132577635 [Heteronotia binoei]|uniref:uncharacterized protein LOC132577635 n=1 Tax=Heteronotia binoei TaxID=13085 RepID=UPI00292DA715|nr:uncharacterized protein LOC132577635 [Heteronotia binoei]